MIKKHTITIDRNKSYGENLANEINRYWGIEVAREADSHNAVIPGAKHGIPAKFTRNSHTLHRAIIRVSRNGSHWTVQR